MTLELRTARPALIAAIPAKTFATQKIDLTLIHVHVYSTPVNAGIHLNGRRLAAEPRFLPSVIGQK
jgi:hypothetical protein